MIAAATTRVARPRRSQAERRAESDRRILQAAAALVVERGVDGASLAAIGRRAGFSHGLVAQRFGSKDDLVERLNQAGVELFTHEAAAAVHGRQGLAALEAIADAYLRLVRGANPAARLHLVLWTEAIARRSTRRPYRAAWDRYFRAALVPLVEQGVADGDIRGDVPADALAVAVVGLLRGVALQLILDPGCAPDGDAGGAAVRQLRRMVGTGVTARPATAPVRGSDELRSRSAAVH